MIVAHEIQQLGLGGAEKTMLLFLRHLRDLGVGELHAFAPRGRDLDRASQVAEVAQLHLYDDLQQLEDEVRVLRPNILHRHRSGYADAFDRVELDPRTRVVETNIYGDHGSRADLRLFVSETVAREQGWQGPVDVLYNPCERPVADAAVPRSHRRFEGIPDAEVTHVVVFGRVGRPSAHIYDPIALEAYAKIESPRTRYLALAPPPNMLDHARWLGLSTFLALPPTLSDWELSRYYSLIDVLAHARRDGETCGMNIQEAMMHGLPVITHLSDTHNAQTEVLGEDYPWIAPRGDLAAYVAYMEQAVSSPERRVELGERNRERSSTTFEARGIVERLLEHYRRLLQD